jgi:hypothetical protein
MRTRISRNRYNIKLGDRNASSVDSRQSCGDKFLSRLNAHAQPTNYATKSARPMEAQLSTQRTTARSRSDSPVFTFSTTRPEPTGGAPIKVTRSATGRAAFFEIAFPISSGILAATLHGNGVKGTGIKQGSCAISGYEFPSQTKRRNRNTDRMILPLLGNAVTIHQGDETYYVDLLLRTINTKPFRGPLIIARETSTALHITIAGKLLRDFTE